MHTHIYTTNAPTTKNIGFWSLVRTYSVLCIGFLAVTLFFAGATRADAATLTLSGTLYSDEGITALTSGKTIAIAIGTSTVSLLQTTSNGSGAWTYTLADGQYVVGSTPIVVWVDGSATRAAVFTKASSTSNITGLDLYENRVIVRHEAAGTSTTNANMSFYDGDNDSDIPYTANSNALSVRTGSKLYIWTGKSFTPGGPVTVNGNAGSGTDGSFHISSAATYTAGGTTTIAGNFSASSTATFTTHASGTVFNATTTGKSITVSLATLGDVTFNGSGGGWTIGTTSTTSNLTITTGTVTAPTTTLTIMGNYTNTGTFTHNSGTVYVASTTTGQGLYGTLTGTSAFSTLRTIGATTTATTSSLIGKWMFEEGAGTTVRDASGNGNTGTLVGGPSWTTGKIGRAVSFDGSDDYVTVTQGGKFNVHASPFTISTWANDNTPNASLGTFHRIVSWYDGTNNIQLGLAQNNSGGRAYYALNNTPADIDPKVVSTGDVPFGWNHVTITYDGASTYHVYLNGVLSDGGTLSNQVGTYSGESTTLYIGQRGDPAGFMSGGVDDVRIYGRALTSAEISDLYSERPKLITLTASTTNLTIDSGVVYAPTTTLSISGNYTNNGTFFSNESTTTFNGASAQVLSGTMVATSTLTKMIFSGAGTKAFSNNASTTDFTIESTSGAVTAPSSLTIMGNYTNNSTFTNNSGTVYIASTTATQRLAGTMTGSSAFSTLRFAGATTSATSTGLVGKWMFEEGSGTTARDASGNANTGTLAGGPVWTTGKIGAALDFDGADDYVSAGSPASLDDLTQKTIAAWINPQGYGESNFGRIFDKEQTSGAGWILYMCTGAIAPDCTGTVRFAQAFDGVNTAWNPPDNTISLNTWQHVAVTYDKSSATNDPSIYINGVLMSNFADNNQTGTAGSDAANSLWIGDRSGNDRAFDGAIDDARIYNRILTASEISGLYNEKPKVLSNNASSTNLTIDSGVVSAPESLTLTGNYANSGAFTHNAGTTTLSGTTQQTLSGTMTGTSTFYNLAVKNSTASTTFSSAVTVLNHLQATTPSAKIEFPASATATVGYLTITGTTGNEVKLRSTTPGTKAGLAITGTTTITYADVKDSSGASPTGNIYAGDGTSIDSGNTNGWTFAIGGGGGGAPAALTISGYLYTDAGQTLASAGKSVILYAATGTPSRQATTTTSGGFFSFSIGASHTIGTSTPLTIFVDGDAALRAVTVTKATSSTSSVMNLPLYKDRVIIKNESTGATSTTIADMARYDGDDDSDIQFLANSGTLSVNKGNELYIWQNSIFYASGTVTVNGNAGTSTDGSLYVAGTYIPNSTTTIAGNLYFATSSTYYANPQGIVLNATTTGKYITHKLATGTPTLGNLNFSGSGGSWQFASDNATVTNMAIGTNATVTAPLATLVVKGNLTQNGQYRNNSGTLVADGYNTTFSGTMTGTSSFAGVTVREGTAEQLAIAYNTPETNIFALTIDTANGVLYAGSAAGILYRCALSTGCDASGDYTSVLDTTEDAIYSLVIDSVNGVLYAGADNVGVIYRCVLSTGCDASGDFTTAINTAQASIRTLAIDSVNGVLYAGAAAAGNIYRCLLSTGCDASGDFTTAYATGEDEILSLVVDTANGTLYVSTGSNGIIYRCALSTACDASGDFTTAYDTSESYIFSLVIDTYNGVLYVGTAGSGIIYRCALATACDTSGDFTTSYDSSEIRIRSFTIDTTTGILYAGTGDTGFIYRCFLATGCDTSSEFTIASDTSESDIHALVAYNGVLYAGTSNSGIIYRYTPGGTDSLTLSNNTRLTNLSIGSYATVTSPSELTVSGTFTNTGSFAAGTSTVFLAGARNTVTGSMTATSSFNHVTIGGSQRFGTTSTSSLFGGAVQDPTASSDVARATWGDDTALYVTGYCDGCGNLGGAAYHTIAYRKTDGSFLWSTTTDPTSFDDRPTATWGDDTALYVTGYCFGCGNRGGTAYYTIAYRKTDGSFLWSTTTDPTTSSDAPQATWGDDTALYVTGYCTGCGALGSSAYHTIAYRKTDGSFLWSTTTDPTASADIAYATWGDDTALYVTGYCTGCGTLGSYAYHTIAYRKTDGSFLWSTTTDPTASSDVATDTWGDDTALYVTGYCDGCGNLGGAAYYTIAYRKTDGSFLWSTTTDPTTSGDTANATWGDDTALYVTGYCTGCGALGSSAYHTIAYRKTDGSFLWSTTTDPTTSSDAPQATWGDDTALYVTGYCFGCGNRGGYAYYTVKYDKRTGALINGENTATFSGNASTTGNFYIQNGGLNATNTVIAPTSLTIGGNYTNNGTFTHNSGTVYMASTTMGQGMYGTLNGTSAFSTLRTIGATTTATTSGMVGKWMFEEGVGTTVRDASGNGNTGTFVGGPSWTTGKIAKAVDLDGAGDYVDLGLGASFYDLTQKTIAAWIKPRSYGGGNFGRILDKTGGGSAGWLFYVCTGAVAPDCTNTVRFSQFFDGVSSLWNPPDNTISLNTWQHVVVTYDKSSATNDPSIYINGVLMSNFADSNQTGTAGSDAANSLWMGDRSFNDRSFDGSIDDVRIYNRILTAAEVSDLYNERPKLITTTASTTNLTIDSGVVYAPTTTLSISGNYTNNGTFFSNESTTTFNGASAQTLSGTMVATSTLTKMIFSGAGTKAFSNNASTTDFTIESTSGAVTAPSSLTIMGNYTNNSTFTNNSGTVYIASTTAAQGLSGTMTGTSAFSTLRIIGATTTGTTTGLVGKWMFEEGTGTTVRDASGNANTGTLTNGPTWTTGKIGKAVMLDGADDYVDAGSNSSLDNLAAMTVSAWINPRSMGETSKGRIFNKAATIAPDNGWIFFFTNAEGNYQLSFNVDYDTTDIARRTGTDVVTPNVWQHVAATWDGSSSASNVKIYVNGTEASYVLSDNGVGSRVTDAAQTLLIGNSASGDRAFDGAIDDARIYNRILTASEISGLYNEKPKVLSNNASTTNITIDSGVVSAPESLTLTGNYANSGAFTHNAGTTTLSGTTQQTLSGTMTGTSTFYNLAVKNSTASTTFSSAVTVLNHLQATTPSAKIEFPASATATVGYLTITGTTGNEVKLRSTTPGTKAGLAITGTTSITYADVKDSSGTSTTGTIYAGDGTSIDSGNNNGWAFLSAGSVTISSGANQTFALNYPTTTISTITITDALTPGITAANDLRIVIASSSVNMRFDTTDTTATFGGTASGKVSNPVTYEGNGTILVIPVDTNFSASDTLTIADLSFAQFAAINVATSAVGVRAAGAGSTTAARDDKTVTVTGSLTLSEHDSGQAADAFTAPSDTDAEFVRYKLTPSGENMSPSSTVFTVTGVNGVVSDDLTNMRLYRDINNDGVYGASDVQIGGTGVVSISGQTGTITFGTPYSATTSQNYVLVGNYANIRPGDSMTVSIPTTGFEVVGSTTLGTVPPVGSASRLQHMKGGGGTGGSSGAIGGDAPAGVIRGGGGAGGGDDIDTDTGGVTLGNEPGFRAPSANSGSWTTGGSGYDSDATYATAVAGVTHTYSTFGFNVPSNNTITGIEVKIEGAGSTAAGSIQVELSWNNGSNYSTAQTTGTLTATDAVYTLGSPSDTWGHSWTPSETADGAFTLRVTAVPSGNTVKIDAIRVNINHQATGGGGGGGGEVSIPSAVHYAGAGIMEKQPIIRRASTEVHSKNLSDLSSRARASLTETLQRLTDTLQNIKL